MICSDDVGNRFLQTLVPICHITWCHILEDCNPNRLRVLENMMVRAYLDLRERK